MDPNDIYRPHSLYKRKFDSDSSSEDEEPYQSNKRRREDDEFKTTAGYALKSGLYDLRTRSEFDPNNVDSARKSWYTIPTETGRTGDPERLVYLRSKDLPTLDELDEIRSLEDRIDTTEYSPNWLANYVLRITEANQDPFYTFCRKVAGYADVSVNSIFSDASMKTATKKLIGEVEILKKRIKEASTDIITKLEKLSRIDERVQKLGATKNRYFGKRVPDVTSHVNGVWNNLEAIKSNEGYYISVMYFSLMASIALPYPLEVSDDPYLIAKQKRGEFFPDGQKVVNRYPFQDYDALIRMLIPDIEMDQICSYETMKNVVFYVLLDKFIKNAQTLDEQYLIHTSTLLGLTVDRIRAISGRILPNEISLLVPLAGDKNAYIKGVSDKLWENYQLIRQAKVNEDFRSPQSIELDVAERALLRIRDTVTKTHEDYRRTVNQMAKGISSILSASSSDDIALSCPRYSKETIDAGLKANNVARVEDFTLLKDYTAAIFLDKAVVNDQYTRSVFEPYDVFTFARGFEVEGVTSWISNNYTLRKKVQDFNTTVYNTFSIRLFESEEEYSLLDTDRRNEYMAQCSGITEPSALLDAIFNAFSNKVPARLLQKKELLKEYLDNPESLFNVFYFADAKLPLVILSYDLIRNVILQLSQSNMRLYTDTYDQLKRSAENMNKSKLEPARDEIERLINMDNSFEWITRPENFGLIMPDNTLMSQIDTAWLDVKKNCRGFRDLDFMQTLHKTQDSDFWIPFGIYVGALLKRAVQTSGRQYSTIKLMDTIQRDLNGSIQDLYRWEAISTSKGIMFEYR